MSCQPEWVSLNRMKSGFNRKKINYLIWIKYGLGRMEQVHIHILG